MSNRLWGGGVSVPVLQRSPFPASPNQAGFRSRQHLETRSAESLQLQCAEAVYHQRSILAADKLPFWSACWLPPWPFTQSSKEISSASEETANRFLLCFPEFLWQAGSRPAPLVSTFPPPNQINRIHPTALLPGFKNQPAGRHKDVMMMTHPMLSQGLPEEAQRFRFHLSQCPLPYPLATDLQAPSTSVAPGGFQAFFPSTHMG